MPVSDKPRIDVTISTSTFITKIFENVPTDEKELKFKILLIDFLMLLNEILILILST